MEVESLVRENRSLNAQGLMLQGQLMEQVSELGRLREIVGEGDREKYRLKGQVDKNQREVQRLGEETRQVGSIVKKERDEREEEAERLEAQVRGQRRQMAD